jgi:uncharacterized membrane protein
MTLKPISRSLLSTFFVLAGINHFWHTAFYVSIMPPYLPWHEGLVIISGVAEVVLGAMLWVRRWSHIAAWGLILLCMAVYPANIHMALHPQLYPWATPTGLWLRLPLQLVLIGWAYWHTRVDGIAPEVSEK